MSGSQLTRRALLRRGVAAAGATVASAGCSGLFGSDGGTTDVFTRWLPAPAARNTDSYRFDYFDLSTLAAQREQLGGEPTVFERTWQPVELSWDDAAAVVAVGGVDVVTAEFDRAAAVSDLQAAGYERAGEYKGYARYRNGATGTVFAVADGTMLVSAVARFAAESADPTDRIETVVDAATGDVDRYTETNEDMAALVEELGRATLVSGRTMAEPDTARSGRLENLVAEGARSTVDGATVDEKWVFVYDRPRDVDTATLEAYVQANDNSSDGADAFASVEDISYTREGRTGIITGTRDASEYYADS